MDECDEADGPDEMLLFVQGPGYTNLRRRTLPLLPEGTALASVLVLGIGELGLTPHAVTLWSLWKGGEDLGDIAEDDSSTGGGLSRTLVGAGIQRGDILSILPRRPEESRDTRGGLVAMVGLPRAVLEDLMALITEPEGVEGAVVGLPPHARALGRLLGNDTGELQGALSRAAAHRGRRWREAPLRPVHVLLRLLAARGGGSHAMTYLLRWAGENPEVRRSYEMEEGGEALEVLDLTRGQEEEGSRRRPSPVTLPAVVWTNEEWFTAVSLFVDAGSAASEHAGWARHFRTFCRRGDDAAAQQQVLGTTLAAGFLRATRLPRMFPTAIPILRTHFAWLARSVGLEGQRGAQALALAEAFAFDMAMVARALGHSSGRERIVALRVFRQIPGYRLPGDCPPGYLATSFGEVAVALVGIRMAAGLEGPTGPGRLEAAQQLYRTAQTALHRAATTGGNHQVEAAEVVVAQELLQGERAAGHRDEEEQEACVICMDAPAQGEEERCSAGCRAVFCRACMREATNVLPPPVCFRCRSLNLGGRLNEVHTVERDLGAAEQFTDHHPFLLVHDSENGPLAQQQARLRRCPGCQQSLQQEQILRLGVDFPPFEVGDGVAEEALQRELGERHGFSNVGSCYQECMRRPNGEVVEVLVEVAAAAVPNGGGGGDVLCRLTTAPTRRQIHDAIRAQTSHRLHVTVVMPLPGGDRGERRVPWYQVRALHPGGGLGGT